MITKLKKKKCQHCKQLFQPARSTLEVACSPNCALEKAKIDREKRERKELREAKLRIKPRSKWLDEAQREFNKYIRMRDEKDPCISCGRLIVEWTRGGQWDCGHYLSRGAYPELRFEELNAHKQCKSCNGGCGKYAKKNKTVSNGYRESLIKKIGLDRVEWLEGPHEIKNYTIDDLKQIKALYKKKQKGIV